MKPLDVINSVDFGYRLAWAERHYLLRLAAVPLFVRLVCLLAVVGLGWEQEYLRRALIMLPSFFTEGWLLAHLVRLVFHGQRWPFRSSGDKAQDEALLLDRAHGIMAGTLFYVVIKFLMTGCLAIALSVQMAAQSELAVVAQTNTDPNPIIILISLAVMVLTLWGFRFIFLYIPAAAGISAQFIIRARQGFLLSIQMLGVWMVCSIPFVLLTMIVISAVIPSEPGAALPMTARIVFLLLEVVTETLIAIVSTAAIAAGLRNMIENPKPSR
ncbi:MAG: hypothetical protein ACXW4B_00235 [Micavibrio sp.]